MRYKIIVTKRAQDALACLELYMADRIISKLEFFESSGNPMFFAKRLINNKLGKYRFRVGDYRIFFEIDDKGQIFILYVLAIKHRREAYL